MNRPGIHDYLQEMKRETLDQHDVLPSVKQMEFVWKILMMWLPGW